jgi:hypothetical protein
VVPESDVFDRQGQRRPSTSGSRSAAWDRLARAAARD